MKCKDLIFQTRKFMVYFEKDKDHLKQNMRNFIQFVLVFIYYKHFHKCKEEIFNKHFNDNRQLI